MGQPHPKKNLVYLKKKLVCNNLGPTDMEMATVTKLVCNSNEMATGTKWKPPPAGIFKVNVAERRFSEDRMGIGIVVRDDSGDVLAALSEPAVNDGNNSWRMAKAILRALHFCVDTGFHSFILECSNAAVVSFLQGDSKCYTKLEWIIRNIQDV
jgi:hypothetical protein